MSDQLPSVVKHVEENNLSVHDWIHGSIMKLEEIIWSYSMKDENGEDIKYEQVTDDLRRSQRYMQEINDIIKYRRPFIKNK